MRGGLWVPTGLEPPRDGPGPTQTAHAGAHRGSRQPHEASAGLQRHPDAPGSDFEAISERFRYPQDLEKPQKCCTVSEFRGSRDFARGPSTEAQKAPNGAPPGGPNVSQARTGRPQEQPKSRPRDPKRPPRGPRRPQSLENSPGHKAQRRVRAPLRRGSLKLKD